MKNIEALIFTDLHLNDINKDICLSFIDRLIQYVKEKDIPRIIFMGDMVDVRKGPSEVSLRAIQNIFYKFSVANLEYKLEYFPGNHDKFIEDGESSYLELFVHYCPHLHRDIECFKTEGKYDYVFFPYFEGEHFEKAIGWLDYAQFDKPVILFAHYMYEQIPQEIKKKFKKIFLGHNHDRSDFPNGMYIGSCFPQNFSEDNNKGFTILYDDLTTELIPFTSQEYITQKIDINAFEEEQIKEFIQKFKNENPDKLLKVEFVGYNKDISNLKNFCKKLNIYYTSNIDNNVINQKEEVLNISQFSSNQIKEQFEIFCQENNISEDVKNKISSILIKS